GGGVLEAGVRDRASRRRESPGVVGVPASAGLGCREHRLKAGLQHRPAGSPKKNQTGTDGMNIQLILIFAIVGVVALVVAAAVLVALPLSAVLAGVIGLQAVGMLKRVPFSYNIRNLFVRWKTTALTALCVILVVGLLPVMLAF